MKIGFCGLGALGAAIVERLIDKGHALTVWNRTPAKAQPLIERGAVAAADPAAVADAVGVVVTCLLDDAAIREVYGRLLARERPGTLFIDMSTVSAPVLHEAADRAQARGAALLECPVAGAPMVARQGHLLGFAGGDEADFARARPLLEDVCRAVRYFGPLGSGAAVKLAVNLPLIAYFEALGEALALVREVKADPADIVAMLADSPGGANVMKLVGPTIAEALASGRQPPGFSPLAKVRKDLGLMLDAAERLGAELPLAAAALQSYDDAVAAGWGDRPFWALSLWRRDA